MMTFGAALLPSKLKTSLSPTQKIQSFLLGTATTKKKKNEAIVPVARLVGPAVFEASKLKVVYVGDNKEEKLHNPKLPRTYTLTHCDITSNLTLAISKTINTSQLQGWYSRLQRDEVVAVWKKMEGKMSLHVHCHISGGHFLLDIFAKLRYYIFCKELPTVLKAFVHGDDKLFKSYPELQEALAWVYFHSNIPEFNKVECWGPLHLAMAPPQTPWPHHLIPHFNSASSRFCNVVLVVCNKAIHFIPSHCQRNLDYVYYDILYPPHVN